MKAQDDSARASGRLFGRYSDEQMRALLIFAKKQAEKAGRPYLITEKFKANKPRNDHERRHRIQGRLRRGRTTRS